MRENFLIIKNSFNLLILGVSVFFASTSNAADSRKIPTITVHPSGYSYPNGNNHHGGGANCHGSVQGMNAPWATPKFQNAIIGQTNVMPGCTTNVPFGVAFVPNHVDLTIMALKSINVSPNNSITSGNIRHGATQSWGESFIIPSDADIARGETPYFQILPTDRPEVKISKAQFNQCVEDAFNDERGGMELAAFAAICKQRVAHTIKFLKTTRWKKPNF